MKMTKRWHLMDLVDQPDRPLRLALDDLELKGICSYRVERPGARGPTLLTVTLYVQNCDTQQDEEEPAP